MSFLSQASTEPSTGDGSRECSLQAASGEVGFNVRSSYFVVGFGFGGSLLQLVDASSLVWTYIGSQSHHRDGIFGPNSIMVVYMDPLG